MTPDDPNEIFERAIAALASSAEDALSKAVAEGLPDRAEVVDWVERCMLLVLIERDRSALRSEIPALADRLRRLLAQAALRGGASPDAVVVRFVQRLPAVRALLAVDVEAAFEGDPAAKSFAEIVVAYPSIRAIAIYSIAHELYVQGVPPLPRMMTEHAHDRTGNDTLPGARIGRRFFIDHGTAE